MSLQIHKSGTSFYSRIPVDGVGGDWTVGCQTYSTLAPGVLLMGTVATLAQDSDNWFVDVSAVDTSHWPENQVLVINVSLSHTSGRVKGLDAIKIVVDPYNTEVPL